MTGSRAIALAAAFVGLLIGIGSFTFVYAKGYSYLTNDPRACANCHVMQDHFDAWTRSSHRSVAVCNDCHTPPGLVPKVHDQGAERLLALLLLYDRKLSRSAAHHAAQSPRHREGVPQVPR